MFNWLKKKEKESYKPLHLEVKDVTFNVNKVALAVSFKTYEDFYEIAKNVPGAIIYEDSTGYYVSTIDDTLFFYSKV